MGDTRGGQPNKDAFHAMAMAKVNLVGVVQPAHSSAVVGNTKMITLDKLDSDCDISNYV